MKKILYIIFLIGSLNVLGQNTYVVTEITDYVVPQQGELRWAINEANNHPGVDYIQFNIPVIQAPVIIQLTSAITITDAILIDGNTQPLNGYNGAEPKIHLKGSAVVSSGIFILNAAYNVRISDITFSDALNGPAIALYGANYSFVQNCVFYGNGGNGVELIDNCQNLLFKGNYFGTNRAKTLNSPNLYNLITKRSSGSALNSINNKVEENYFANNNSLGLQFYYGTGNRLTNNTFVNCALNIDIGYANLPQIPANCFSYSANNCKVAPVINQATLVNNTITISGTSTAANDIVEVFKSDGGGKNALVLVGIGISNASLQWTLSVPNSSTINIAQGDVLIATATDGLSNTSQFSPASAPVSNPCATACPGGITFSNSPSTIFINQAITFTNSASCSLTNISWEIKNISSGAIVNYTGAPAIHTFVQTGSYLVTILGTASGCPATYSQLFVIGENIPCENCFSSFAPEAGRYILSAWVKEDGAAPSKLSYTEPEIKIYFPTTPSNLGTAVYTCTSSGAIIDGWQRVETEIMIPPTAAYINLQLNAKSGNCFFDDIRIFPKDGAMTSFVYDPINMRLMAELDERNYATLYEYDEEGKLIRVKKETEKGVMTIKENKNSTKKK